MDKPVWTPQSMGKKGAAVLKQKYGTDYFKILSALGRKALPREHFVKMAQKSREARRRKALEHSETA